MQEIMRRNILGALLKDAKETYSCSLIKFAIEEYKQFNYDLEIYKKEIKKLENERKIY